MVSLCTVLQAGCATFSFGFTPRAPLVAPIDLTKAGNKTEIQFRITDERLYEFRLAFYYNELDSKKVRKIVGYNGYFPGGANQLIPLGSRCDYEYEKKYLGDLIDETYDCDGTIIPINLTIYRIEGEGKRSLILRDLYITKGHSGGNHEVYLRLFMSRSFKKDKYIAVLENPQGFPELAGRDIRLSISKTNFK